MTDSILDKGRVFENGQVCEGWYLELSFWPCKYDSLNKHHVMLRQELCLTPEDMRTVL